ncbi:hypothetical protein KFZ58_00455 [Virgibacillus sp. NKC19-16]|uniref:hypothetical protein n=1 Tax=Virgibacillus salidurans TaxID=2831673 RepID=UPI001F2F473C|nr:hypothetical protein [Virgibacillus sp. NKC19-16]UJL46493.1 hypothetical protein KFZ58_00455 [Virgibacillus sp. NKC19-16]
MKRFIIFIVSFVVIFFFIQLASGVVLTTFYTPDLSEAWNMSGNLPQEVALGKSSYFPTLLIAVVAAALAYLIPKMLKRFSK